MSQDGWIWQGRQGHGWFGHGTGPRGGSPPGGGQGGGSVPATLDERIRAVGSMSVAGLPHAKRRHPAAGHDGAALDRLVGAMRAWAGAGHLGDAGFAAHFFDRHPSGPVVRHLRRAAELVRTAATSADIREATDELAAGMLAVGLDGWPRFLMDAHARATAPWAVAERTKPSGGLVVRVADRGEDERKRQEQKRKEQQQQGGPQFSRQSGGMQVPSIPLLGGAAPALRGAATPTARGGEVPRAAEDRSPTMAQTGQSGVVPGRVQSRINISGDGLAHTAKRHMNPSSSGSQFTISQSEVVDLLKEKPVISAPVSVLGSSGNFVREVDVGRIIGVDAKGGNSPTSIITVITDHQGNLITVFPGTLTRSK